MGGTYLEAAQAKRSSQQKACTAWPTQIFAASALDWRRHDPLPSALMMSGPAATLARRASGPSCEILMAIRHPHRALLARQPICAPANRRPPSGSQRCTLSASMRAGKLRMHIGGGAVSVVDSRSLSGRWWQAFAVSCSCKGVIWPNHTPPPSTAPKQPLQKTCKRSPPEGSLSPFSTVLCCYSVYVCVLCSRHSLGIGVSSPRKPETIFPT